MNFLRKLIDYLRMDETQRAAWRTFRHFNLLGESAPIPFTAEERRSMRTFFSTEIGKRVTAILQHQEARQCGLAATSEDDRDYRCGYAAGYRGAVAQLFSLAAPPEELDEIPSAIDQDLKAAGLESLRSD